MYKSPILTDMSLGEAEINGEKYEVVGVAPFLLAVATAVAAVAKAVELFDDGYTDISYVNSLEEVKE